ncbi:MAG: GNAT family N-acetyltransferase [Chloroflexi bacterium]|nr:GNAT family N-acetyltransferase [Chloroflexota bacterium]
MSEEAVSFVTRLMTPADLKTVCQIDRDAFEAYHRQQRRLMQPLRLRTPENMNAAVRRPYAGVVVETSPGRVAGYCFTHVWGSLGWLGTLGVAPNQQGLGLGRAVIAAGLDLLHQAGCRIRGLETMPESGKNLALYTRLGLDAQHLTMVFQGLTELAAKTHYELWDGEGALRQIASAFIPGLDPTPAALWLDDEGGGETIVWREDGQEVAFAVLRAAGRRLETMQNYLNIEVAACLPEAANHWPRYLAEMQTYAHRLHRSGLLIPVSAQQKTLLHGLLEAGMQIAYSRVRMTDSDPLGDPDALLMLTLAM